MTAPPRLRTTVEPAEIDARVRDVMRGMAGQGITWNAGPVDLAALLRLAALVAKGIGVPFDEVVVALRVQWDELPDASRIRDVMREPR